MQLEQIEEILLSFSYKEEFEQDAHKSFELLYKEYSKFLKILLETKLSQSGIHDEQIVESVIGNTFLKIYNKPLIFEIPPDCDNDACFKAWLSVVARNEMFSLLKDLYKINNILEVDIVDAVFDDTEIDDERFESINLKQMQGALNSLPERDKEILLTLFMYHEQGKKSPSDVLDTLCKTYGTTRDNIRQIRKRSIAKIEQYFSKFSVLKPIRNEK